MLFVEGKTLRHTVNSPQRIHLLEGLREKNLIPVIRSARLASFNSLSLLQELIPELETSIALAVESETQEAYIRGDLFAFSDHVFFLLFDEQETPIVRAGIIYEPRTTEPFRKLDTFCVQVRELLEEMREPHNSDADQDELLQWEHGKPTMPAGFKRFVARQDTDSLFTSSRKETITERIRAASMLEDANARVFLRRAKEAHMEGYAGRLLTGDAAESYQDSINRLEDAGLVGREVQISCRKTGHALFRLPNAHALAVVTVSDATCSECGSPVADEKVEDVFAPTRLASSLLEDGSWLISRLHYLLREQGIPESEIAVVPSDRDGYGQMMANICGEPFLLVARDGDLTPGFARWAIDLELETEASHLVVVATGRIHNQGGLLLRNHARQRAMGGRDFELVLTDDAVTAANELRNAFERVSQRVVAEQVCHLDSSLGLNVSQMIITKFNLSKSELLKDEEPLESEIPAQPRLFVTLAQRHSEVRLLRSPHRQSKLTQNGDLTPSFARWAIDLELETEASHLVVVATGRIHNQGGLLLRNHARQRAMGGRDFELVLTDDAVTAANELRNAFERVSQRVVAEQVCHLDSSLGLNVSQMIITKFNLSKSELLKDEEPLESESLPSESEPDFAAPGRPLALAAAASTTSADVLIPEVVMTEPLAENLDNERMNGE